MQRRDVFQGLALAAFVATPVPRLWAAAQDDASEMVAYLFVQNAQAVVLLDGALTLQGISPDTLYFSDRPQRIVGRVTTQAFVEHWATGTDSFKADPPNAVLSVLHRPTPQDIVVVLKQPRLDGANLAYEVEVLDGPKTVRGEQVAVFIDLIGRPLTPLSYAGMVRRMARRTSRRTARRVNRRN